MASAEVERTMAIAFVGARAAELLFSAAMMAANRRDYRRPGRQVAVFAAVAAESAWLAWRIRAEGGYRGTLPRRVDTAFAAAGLIVSESGLGEAGAPWMKNIAIGATLGAAGAEQASESYAMIGVLAAAAVARGLVARGRDGHASGVALAVNDAVSWIGTYSASRIYVTAHRRFAELSTQAEAVAVAAARETAAEAERSGQQRRLHRITIEALHQLADSTELETARRLARQEAARLRHALRSGGESATDLQAALADVAGTAAEAQDLGVELVTAEIDGVAAPSAVVEVLREALYVALTAVAQFAGVTRVVVRVSAQDGQVRMMVRDQGGGFEPGGATAHERHLAGLAEIMGAEGGTAHVWSALDRGTRVVLSIPAGSGNPSPQDRDDQTVQGGPQPGSGPPPALDYHIVRDRDHVQHCGPCRPARAAQRERRGLIVHGTHTRRVGWPFQTGPRQRAAGLDQHLQPFVHLSMMTGAAARVMGISAPLAEDDPPGELVRAERVVTAAFVAWRLTGLLTGAASVAGGWHRHRRPAWAAAQLLGAGAETGWLIVRLARRPQWSDPSAAMVDALAAAALLLGGHRNLDPRDRWTWVDWAPWSFAANAVTGQAMGVRRLSRGTAGAGSVIAVAAALSPSAADGLATSSGMAGFFTMGRVFAAQIRRGARRLVAAQAAAVGAQQRVATERERLVQLRMLHDGAVQILEAVGVGRYLDLGSIRAAAETEADRLTAQLAARGADEDLPVGLAAVIADARMAGMAVTLESAEVPTCPLDVAAAFCGAVAEALNNVRKHADTAEAHVRLERDGAKVVVTVCDTGRGFDPVAKGRGFGTTQSIVGRMGEIGGSALVASVPGEGTTVVLGWTPGGIR
jgi:signal transduction histidine kinase